MAINLFTIFTLCILSYANCKTAKIRQDVVNNDLVLTNVERKIDISTHLAKIVSSITIENTGTSSTGFFLYAIEPQLQENIAFLAASVSWLCYCNTVNGPVPNHFYFKAYSK